MCLLCISAPKQTLQRIKPCAILMLMRLVTAYRQNSTNTRSEILMKFVTYSTQFFGFLKASRHNSFFEFSVCLCVYLARFGQCSGAFAFLPCGFTYSPE